MVLRDIGIDADVILKISDKQAMDREEFCEFLKIEWQGKVAPGATTKINLHIIFKAYAMMNLTC